MNNDADPLNLTIGSVLQIQATVPEAAPRYSVRLIGYLPGAGLIVTTPTQDGRVQIVREGQRFNVRVLKGERVLGFVTQVVHNSMKPYPHLHFEYPTELQQIVVRNASRVGVDIPVLARNTRDEYAEQAFHPATIVDLSETGAKIALDAPLAAAGDSLHLKFELMISGTLEKLGLLGDVRNVTERVESDRVQHYCGIQFRTVTRYQQILLHAWVTHRVLQDALRARGQ